MKSFFILVAFLAFFTGCSHKNAFSNFEMDEKQELSANSLQSSKIKLGERVDGVFSAIYLNEVYPKSFNQHEYFYVYLYLKNDTQMHNPNSLNETKLNLKLNGKTPMKIKELERENQFSNLIKIENRWTKYYLVSFEEQGSRISLVLENGQSSSDELIYQKDEQ